MTSIILTTLSYFVTFLNFMIFARCLLSWIPLGNNPITNFVYILTEPILKPIRDMIYRSPLGGPGMMLDFSPVVAMLLISGIESIIYNLLSAGL